MESNRDDFIIAIRSAILKKGNKQRFSLIFLMIFSIFIIIFSRLDFVLIKYINITLKEVVYRTSFIVSLPENYIKKTYQVINDHFVLYDDYEKIKKEFIIEKGAKRKENYIFLENERLKKIVDDYIISSTEIVAKVLIDKQSPYLRSVIINKGSRDNTILGMAVLDGENLVGKIVEVNYSTSRALLLSDLNSKIPVIIEPVGFQSILSGTGSNNGILQYSKENYLHKNNEILYTSGAGGIFKSGIPIGKINSNIILNGKVTVDFFSNFSQLNFVKIISFDKEKNWYESVFKSIVSL